MKKKNETKFAVIEYTNKLSGKTRAIIRRVADDFSDYYCDRWPVSESSETFKTKASATEYRNNLLGY